MTPARAMPSWLTNAPKITSISFRLCFKRNFCSVSESIFFFELSFLACISCCLRCMFQHKYGMKRKSCYSNAPSVISVCAGESTLTVRLPGFSGKYFSMWHSRREMRTLDLLLLSMIPIKEEDTVQQFNNNSMIFCDFHRVFI